MDRVSEVSIEWDLPLFYRRGSPKRLNGIDIFYDFPWLDQFRDERAQFKNGLCLTNLAKRDCPVDKKPALLLTRIEDVLEDPIETEDRFIVVVNIQRYISEASNNAAASYYANKLSVAITNLSRVTEIVNDPIAVADVIERTLDAERISKWLEGRPDRMHELRGLVMEPRPPTMDPASIASAILAIKNLDAEQIAALEGLFRGTDKDIRLTLLRALTVDEFGRLATSAAIGERLTDRLRDASAAADTFSFLSDSGASETDLQRFIEGHPWLLGMEYVRVLPRHTIPRGSIDFLLQRFDGYYDLLELKGPNDSIIEVSSPGSGTPPPASSYSLSRSLAQAIAQVLVYRETLTNHSGIMSELYGLERTRLPRLLIVLGRTTDLSSYALGLLRSLNLSLHRVEVVPFDILADRARTIVRNIEGVLGTTQPT